MADLIDLTLLQLVSALLQGAVIKSRKCDSVCYLSKETTFSALPSFSMSSIALTLCLEPCQNALRFHIPNIHLMDVKEI